MVEDNTPTVISRRRKPTGHQRLRLDTANRLQALSQKNKERRSAKKVRNIENDVQVLPEGAAEIARPKAVAPATTGEVVKTKKPKIKKSKLREPPIPPAKFRKRQISKTWLPTHLWHSKRARMTPPKDPMWRFALPLTPNMKNYRNTHRASADKGAIAWDMSYMSTIGLSGSEAGIVGLLKALGVSHWGSSGTKWRAGTRSWEGWVHERDSPHLWIAPITVLWNPIAKTSAVPDPRAKPKTHKREVFLRVHASAFLQLWEQVFRLAKVQKPALSVEDLRYEIGSIEITGPDATEALVAVLRPLGLIDETGGSLTAEELTWTKLGRTSPAALPTNALVAMTVLDPRLRFPPRTLPVDELRADDPMLVKMLGSWPLDRTPHQAAMFNHMARVRAKRSLPTQKAVNRRKGQADPGRYPTVLPTDPPIPILAFAERGGAHSSGSWTVLLPWACVSPVWKSLVYYPLSTGGVIRFGGVNEKRQLAYENDTPWFPADFPATKAGQQWEYDESNRRKADWVRKPKSRKTAYESVYLGNGKKGEMGVGWECDWQCLVQGVQSGAEEELIIAEAVEKGRPATNGEAANDTVMEDAAKDDGFIKEVQESTDGTAMEDAAKPDEPMTEVQASIVARVAQSHPVVRLNKPLHFMPASTASQILVHGAKNELQENALATIKITMLTRGRPSDCARVYRLPTDDPKLRQKWLAQQPSPQSARSNSKRAKFPPKPDVDASAMVQRSWLAAAILTKPAEPGHKDYPTVPGEEDLIGFVTTGNFSLKEGKGVGIGSVLVERILPGEASWEGGGQGKQVLKREHCLCIVRDSGESHGRLAAWSFV